MVVMMACRAGQITDEAERIEELEKEKASLVSRLADQDLLLSVTLSSSVRERSKHAHAHAVSGGKERRTLHA